MTAALKYLTYDQLDFLISFVEENRHLAFGRHRRNNNDDQYEHYTKWRELGREMNALAPEQIPKTGIEYKEYWKELKSKTYNKVYRARQRAKITKQSVKLTLQHYEWRIYNIMEAHSLDRLLILEIGENRSIKTEETESMFDKIIKEEEECNKKQEIVSRLENLTTSLQNLARSQAELAQSQISIIRSLNSLVTLINEI